MLKQLLCTIALLSFSFSQRAIAQVIPDNSLGAESTTIRSIDDFKEAVEGGAIRGDNLFHSFQEFSVRQGLITEFANPEGIANIFSRVTGGGISEILGTLSVDGGANLFLMNPNGVVFGENVVVDVGGSFLTTTAESIEFNNGDSFSAINPNKPTLTIDFPLGLSLGNDPGSIQIKGEQNNVQLEIPSFRVITDDLPQSVAVESGENISLIGGRINLDGGGLQAPQGSVSLVSLDGNQTLRLIRDDDWFTAEVDSVSSFRDISLDNAAYIDVSGEKAGNINLSARNIKLDGGSIVLADTSTSTDNSIDILATDTLEIKGTSGNNELNVFRNNQGLPANAFRENRNFYSISLISADVLTEFNENGTGNDVNVDAENLEILDAGQIRTVSFSQFPNNRAGNINIEASSVLIGGTNNIDGFIGSVINSSTGQGTLGNSGDVDIKASVLEVENGGRIKADTFSSGGGGRLSILSDEIYLESEPNADIVPAVFRTGLSVSPGNKDGSGGVIFIESQELTILDAEINNSSFSDGIPGNIDIITDQLMVLDGGAIRAETASSSSADININAKDIILDGTRQNINDFIGGISTSTRFNSEGNGGNIDIITDSLEILNGSIIRAISLGSGDAGNINVEADRLKIAGVDRFAENPVISERVSKINTGTIRGNGGDIIIESDLIELNDFGTISASSRSGDRGGNITLNANNLELFNQSSITANAGGRGNGGNITINSDTILGINNSDITANAVGGDGGNIVIDNDFIVGLEEQSELTPFSDITASSEFGIDGTVTISAPDNNLGDDAVSEFTGLDNEIKELVIGEKCLNPANPKGKVIYVGRGGIPANPDTFFDDDEIVAVEEIQGQPTIEDDDSSPVWVEGDPIINANAVKVINDEQYLVAEHTMQEVAASICTSHSEK